jgi:prepilin-type N-terminal cleavage/methylation domain-containing protein
MPRPARRRSRHQRGFTLIELLVTLAVTVVGLTGLMSLHIATLKSNERTGDNGYAVAAAQETLESMRSLRVPDLLAKFGATALPIDAALNTIAGPNGTTFRPRVIVQELTAASPDLIKIRVEIEWSDDNANGSGTGSGTAAALDHRVALEFIRTAGDGL